MVAYFRGAVALLILLFSYGAVAADEYMIQDERGVALEGYDPTTFFSGEPEKGEVQYSADYQQTTWYFKSRENLDKFLASPADFIPKYHGYCGWALIKGDLRIGAVEYWRVTDGELYFLCSEEALKRWKNEEEKNRAKADEAWEKMLLKQP